jgi:hypothetical protein
MPSGIWRYGSPLGVTEAIMLAHGITIEMLTVLGRRRPRPCMLVVRVRITDAARLALAI